MRGRSNSCTRPLFNVRHRCETVYKLNNTISRIWFSVGNGGLSKKTCDIRVRYWVHPYIDDRLTRGGFITLFSDLRENPDKFFNYFRMSVQSFDELAYKITDMIKSQDTWMRLSIPPLEMLAVTLR